MTPIEKIEKYSEEVSQDLKINEVTLQDTTYAIPNKKHYWVMKLILEKQELMKMERKCARLKQTASSQMASESPIALSGKKAVEAAINNTDTMKEILQLIEEQKLLVDYLEKVEKIFAFVTNDVKNIIEAAVMQQM